MGWQKTERGWLSDSYCVELASVGYRPWMVYRIPKAAPKFGLPRAVAYLRDERGKRRRWVSAEAAMRELDT